MSDFSVKVWLINEPVIKHPNADRLTIVKIGGYECIANLNDDGSFRYNEGDAVLYIPEGAVLPEWLLRRLDMWNEAENKGHLAGSQGNRVKAIKLRGIVSQGILYPVKIGYDEHAWCGHPYMYIEVENLANSGPDGELLFENGIEEIGVDFDIDYSQSMGIVKYEPPVPTHMSGEVMALFGKPIKYDFENLKSVPDIFTEDDFVVATEKIHGTFCQIGIIKDFEHPELFGKNKNIYICSKGLGTQGFVFKNNEVNKNNLYVKAFLENPQIEHFLEAAQTSYRIFGEIYGMGVQDLHYDCKTPSFAMFDIMKEDEFLPFTTFKAISHSWGIPMVPILYYNNFNYDELVKIRDGKTVLGGKNIREGIVVKCEKNSRHETHGRKIAKMVSPDYLLRKGNVTEYT